MQKKAFLFSAGDYEGTLRFPKSKLDLSGTKYDIAAMEKRLQQIDFSTIKKEDAKKSELLSTIQQEIVSLPQDSVSVVYFTGHGGHCNGINYIYPTDFATVYEKNQSINDAGIDIKEIIDLFKNKGYLILILDSCRKDFGSNFQSNYSEMTVSENVYIAYATMFQKSAIGMNTGLSWFTEALCDEILSTNIDVNELFVNVRNNLYRKHYNQQISYSVDGLLNQIHLHEENIVDDLEQKVYEFIKKYGDEYCDRYGYFQGDDLIFIDAAQYFNISFLDAVWKHKKVDNKVYREMGVHIPELTEEEQKIVTFLNLEKGKKFFSHDKSYTWYYNGRQIRMGEIPPLPLSMQPLHPEPGKEINLQILAMKKDNIIEIFLNLPNGSKILIVDSKHRSSKLYDVIDGKIVLEDAIDILSVSIHSKVFSDDEEVNKVLGEKHRNLCGEHIEYDPVFGKQVVYCQKF